MDATRQDRVKEAVTYNKPTGHTVWKVDNRGRVGKGSIAGCVNAEGYRQIKIGGLLYLEQDLVWLYIYGEFPKGKIMHKNGVKTDNRLANLYEEGSISHLFSTAELAFTSAALAVIIFSIILLLYSTL